jgi:hypothetical protein
MRSLCQLLCLVMIASPSIAWARSKNPKNVKVIQRNMWKTSTSADGRYLVFGRRGALVSIRQGRDHGILSPR